MHPVRPESDHLGSRLDFARIRSRSRQETKRSFYEATCLRPAIYGDALDWTSSAAANGWTTVLDAQPRSIVVFQPGVQGADGTYGHVAWVDSTEQRADGLYITVTEMNGAAGPGRDSRERMNVAGHRARPRSRVAARRPLLTTRRPRRVVPHPPQLSRRAPPAASTVAA